MPSRTARLASLAAAALLIGALSLPAAAAVTCTEGAGAAAGALPAAKRTAAELYLTAVEAHALIAAQPAKVLFLDVRTPGELMFAGVPTTIDANVPVMLLPARPSWDATRHAFRLEPNADFVAEVGRRVAQKGLCPEDPIVVICLAGERAARAANLLTQAGYTQVFTITDGFEGDLATEGPHADRRTVNGWKNAGLPWTYRLDAAKMYKVD